MKINTIGLLGIMGLTAIPAWASMAPPVTLDDANKAVAAGRAVDDEEMIVAVVDKDGHLIAFQRPPCAETAGIYEAHGRAVAAALYGQSTIDLATRIKHGEQSLANMSIMVAAPGDRPTFTPGGEPIVRKDSGGHPDTVGAIGCAGGSDEENRACARAGVAALK